MDKEAIVEEFENFLNEHGSWITFKNWIEDKGYTLDEFGMEDD